MVQSHEGLQLLLEAAPVEQAGQLVLHCQAFQFEIVQAQLQVAPETGRLLQLGFAPGQRHAVHTFLPGFERGPRRQRIRRMAPVTSPDQFFTKFVTQQQQPVLISQRYEQHTSGMRGQAGIAGQSVRKSVVIPQFILGLLLQPTAQAAHPRALCDDAVCDALVAEADQDAVGLEDAQQGIQPLRESLERRRTGCHYVLDLMQLQVQPGTLPLMGKSLQCGHLQGSDARQLFTQIAFAEAQGASLAVVAGNQPPELAPRQHGYTE